MSAEPEPRRSVRATKGQHTKAFDEVAPGPMKRRQTKKSKKAQEQETEAEDEQEEVIRCVCGATEQDEDSGGAWISCETCYAWQHNVCVGVSSYEDEIPDYYWCERCRPQDHTELLEGIAKGEKPWEARRKAFEERKGRRGGRRPKGGRRSDTKDDAERERDSRLKTKASPTPDSAKDTKDAGGSAKGKRKNREDSHDTDGKSSKARRVSASPASPKPKYVPPKDLEPAIKELPPTRNGPAKALKKSIVHVMTSMAKDGGIEVPEGSSIDVMAETSALQIERAVFDTHPMSKGQKEYSQQIKSLTFNLKNNPELMHGLMDGAHTPTTLAVMTSDQLASSEMQRQTAEMRAKAEKASILYQQETSGPRVRRTHKGEEVVEEDGLITNDKDDAPQPSLARRSVSSAATGRDQGSNIKHESGGDSTDQVELPEPEPSHNEAAQQQGSPSQANFDINKVFSSVRSPSTSKPRRPSVLTGPAGGPGEDADVDRMLQDEDDSPPYSPTDEAQDPGVVWRGSLAMSSIADFQARAKHVGGANFASIGPWSKLIPPRLAVAGRIPQQSAIEYLCGLRYSPLTDVVVVNLEPTSSSSQSEFKAIIDYFVSKKRYGVVGDKVAGNVRDTYLVPVPPGEDNHPEFMLNLMDNHIPKSRTEPMLLAVFVYRNDPSQVKAITPTTPATSAGGTPTPAPKTTVERSNSIPGPTFSPATPQAPPLVAAPAPAMTALQSTTPVPIPQPPHARSQQPQAAAAAAAALPQQAQPQQAQQHQPQPPVDEAQRQQAFRNGHAMANEVLGPELMASPTVHFLLPQAWQMSRKEWEVIRDIYTREPASRGDLQFLGRLLEKEGKA
ncbi:SPOC domain [Geosmithia morbida]|uniref:Transcription factor BYE1 n=1 Tax=Geosmithia morbida TaxID=1094350 RepID=A0A9P4YQR9_9HYPO|nr:SPOC domain [Geosmithia morbida]KAF4121401.1 SPOC domain [Geosmithia morbida]